MRAWKLSIVLLSLSSYAGAADVPQRQLVFDKPAESFTESCLLGSGRLGAMVFGGVGVDRVVLNEQGMWSGSPQDADRPDAAAALPEIRRLLLAGRNAEAESLVNRNFTCAGEGSGLGRGKSVPYGSYQVLANLRVEHHSPQSQPFEDYRRVLNLGEATATVSYRVGSTNYRRAAFASAVDNAIIYRVTASKPGAVSLTIGLARPERAEVSFDGHDLVMQGQLEDGRQGGHGVRFAVRVRVVTRGGEVLTKDNHLHVAHADEVMLLVTAATERLAFAGREVTDPAVTAAVDLARVAECPFKALLERHVLDHRSFYNRVSLRIDDGSGASGDTTPDQLANGPANAELVATLFDYGRYLLVGSSRPGGFPANLQGIWAEELQTPWNADWHANVNVQMNYWPAGPCNLAELQLPLVALVESLVEPGQATAKKYYDARGWVAHLLINPWGFTSPGESASWGSTPTCSAWLCQHLWDQYLFTRDEEYLQRVYPVLRGASEFYADMLIEEPAHGWLVTAPSNSPENAFLDEQGRSVHTCMGPTGDQQLLRYLFDAVIQASEVLGTDVEYATQLQTVRNRLAPTQIGADGRVMEWLQERKEADPHHRHMSHLWGLYPAAEINRHDTPEMCDAARKSLEARGDDGTGWAIAYKACLWARLGDGDHALKLLRRLLRPVGGQSEGIRWQGGVYPNLLDAHPPFQIDGNFGATAAVAEMLLQSDWQSPATGEAPVIELLPALPGEWKSGEVRGLKARGAVTVGVAWVDGKLADVKLAPLCDGPITVRYQSEERTLNGHAGDQYWLDGSLKLRRETH